LSPAVKQIPDESAARLSGMTKHMYLKLRAKQVDAIE